MQSKRAFFVCLYHPFRRVRHSVFDALSLGEASLDCFAPLADGCGDFVETLKPFSLFIVSAEHGNGLDETFVPRKMQECDKECKAGRRIQDKQS